MPEPMLEETRYAPIAATCGLASAPGRDRPTVEACVNLVPKASAEEYLRPLGRNAVRPTFLNVFLPLLGESRQKAEIRVPARRVLSLGMAGYA